MYTKKHWFILGVGAAAAILMTDAAYGAGHIDGKASSAVESDPSPDETSDVEPDDTPNLTESDEE